MPILDASGQPMRLTLAPRTNPFAFDALQGLIEKFDSIMPQLTRVPSMIGAVEARRADRWVNSLTGIGTLADKTRHGFFDSVWRIPDSELTNLMNGSDLAAKIIEKRPKEMFRRGFELKANPNAGAKGGGKKVRGKAPVNQSAVKDFRDFCTEELALEDRFKQGMIYGRQYGGALALLGIDDGRDPAEPLDEDNIDTFSFINIVDRRFAWVNSYYANPQEPKFGQPETYMVSNGVAAQDYRPQSPSKIRKRGWSTAIIHETRLIRFDGVATDMLSQQVLAGWSWSVLQRVYEVIRQFDHGFDSAVYLLSDASQGVFKLKGLLQAIGSGNKEWLEQRLQVMEETRSVLRGVAVDADEKGGESFERVNTPMTGIPDMLDRLMQRVSAGADMPVQEVFGAGAGGLNAAGEAQAATRKWYDTIRTEAQDQAAPKLTRVFKLAARAKNSPIGKKDVRWEVKFHALWEPTDEELAKTRLANAQRDVAYVQEEIVAPEVVALTLTDIYPSLDEDDIEAAIEAKKTFDPHENDPPSEPGTPGGPPLPPPGAPAAGGKPGAPGAAGAAAAAPGARPGGPAGKFGALPQKTPAPTASANVQARGRGGEPQSPTLPLPGPPAEQTGALTTAQSTKGDPPTPKKKKPAKEDRKDALEEIDHWDSTDIANDVYAQLSPDYPDSAIAWTKAVPWKGPKMVAIAKIDFGGRAHWRAAKDDLGSYEEKVKKGQLKPIVLVKRPSSKLLFDADGHHRLLAHEKLGRPILAYIAMVDKDQGPWDEMHALQSDGDFASAQKPGKDGDGKVAQDRADAEPLRNAAFVVLSDPSGRILTVSRPEPPHEMSLPGGEVEDAESAEQAALRELREETDVWLEPVELDLVAKVKSPTDGRDVQIFACKRSNTTIGKALEDGTRVAWLRPDELLAQAKLYKPVLEELERQGCFSKTYGDHFKEIPTGGTGRHDAADDVDHELDYFAALLAHAVADTIERYANQLPDDEKSDAAEFNEEDHPRDETGKFAGAGGGAGPKGAGERATPGGGGARGRLHAIVGALRAAPVAIGRFALKSAREKIEEFKSAAIGVKNFATGHPVSHEQAKAMKKVAVFVVSSIIASHATALLPLAHVAGKVGGKLLERLTHEALDHVIEHFSNRGLRLDALAIVFVYDWDEASLAISEAAARASSGPRRSPP